MAQRQLLKQHGLEDGQEVLNALKDLGSNEEPVSKNRLLKKLGWRGPRDSRFDNARNSLKGLGIIKTPRGRGNLSKLVIKRQLTNKELKIIKSLPEENATTSYKKFVEKSGEANCEELLKELENFNLVKKGPGPGGTIRLTDSGEGWRKLIVKVEDKYKAILAGSEAELYDILIRLLSEKFGEGTGKLAKRFYSCLDTSGMKGRGQWVNPDVVSLAVKHYAYIPESVIEVSAFEVKRWKEADIKSVWQTGAYHAIAHYLYLVCECPKKEKIPRRMVEEAKYLNIGLIELKVTDKGKHNLEIKYEPDRREPDHRALDGFIKNIFSYFDHDDLKRAYLKAINPITRRIS